MQYLHNICMHNLWKHKRQISLRTSRGLNGENQVFEMVYYLILTWKSLLKKLGWITLSKSQWLKGEWFTLRTAHSRYLLQNFNTTPNRLSGHISIFGLVVFVLKPLLGNARQWWNFAILPLNPRRHMEILITWVIALFFTCLSLSLCSDYTGLTLPKTIPDRASVHTRTVISVQPLWRSEFETAPSLNRIAVHTI